MCQNATKINYCVPIPLVKYTDNVDDVSPAVQHHIRSVTVDEKQTLSLCCRSLSQHRVFTYQIPVAVTTSGGMHISFHVGRGLSYVEKIAVAIEATVKKNVVSAPSHVFVIIPSYGEISAHSDSHGDEGCTAEAYTIAISEMGKRLFRWAHTQESDHNTVHIWRTTDKYGMCIMTPSGQWMKVRHARMSMCEDSIEMRFVN